MASNNSGKKSCAHFLENFWKNCIKFRVSLKQPQAFPLDCDFGISEKENHIKNQFEAPGKIECAVEETVSLLNSLENPRWMLKNGKSWTNFSENDNSPLRRPPARSCGWGI